MFKNISHIWRSVLVTHPLFRDGPPGAPAFVRLAYFTICDRASPAGIMRVHSKISKSTYNQCKSRHCEEGCCNTDYIRSIMNMPRYLGCHSWSGLCIFLYWQWRHGPSSSSNIKGSQHNLKRKTISHFKTPSKIIYPDRFLNLRS